MPFGKAFLARPYHRELAFSGKSILLQACYSQLSSLTHFNPSVLLLSHEFNRHPRSDSSSRTGAGGF